MDTNYTMMTDHFANKQAACIPINHTAFIVDGQPGRENLYIETKARTGPQGQTKSFLSKHQPIFLDPTKQLIKWKDGIAYLSKSSIWYSLAGFGESSPVSPSRTARSSRECGSPLTHTISRRGMYWKTMLYPGLHNQDKLHGAHKMQASNVLEHHTAPSIAQQEYTVAVSMPKSI